MLGSTGAGATAKELSLNSKPSCVKGSDSRGTKTTAVLEGDEWVINGSKIFITNGSVDISKGCTVQAVTGEEKMRHSKATVTTNYPVST